MFTGGTPVLHSTMKRFFDWLNKGDNLFALFMILFFIVLIVSGAVTITYVE
jgi:hypothetical protein